MEFFKCNETYFCNVTTHYKSFGICPQYTDCLTYPCDVRSCKPHFEPIPGYCQEIDCYFKEEPDPKPNGNGLTIGLSFGFGFLFVATTFGYLYKKGLIRKGWSQIKKINFRGCGEAFWRIIKTCFQATCGKIHIGILNLSKSCLEGLGWCLENVKCCEICVNIVISCIHFVFCCNQNDDSEERRNLVEEYGLNRLPIDDSFNLHTNNIPQTNR